MTCVKVKLSRQNQKAGVTLFAMNKITQAIHQGMTERLKGATERKILTAFILSKILNSNLLYVKKLQYFSFAFPKLVIIKTSIVFFFKVVTRY